MVIRKEMYNHSSVSIVNFEHVNADWVYNPLRKQTLDKMLDGQAIM